MSLHAFLALHTQLLDFHNARFKNLFTHKVLMSSDGPRESMPWFDASVEFHDLFCRIYGATTCDWPSIAQCAKATATHHLLTFLFAVRLNDTRHNRIIKSIDKNCLVINMATVLSWIDDARGSYWLMDRIVEYCRDSVQVLSPLYLSELCHQYLDSYNRNFWVKIDAIRSIHLQQQLLLIRRMVSCMYHMEINGVCHGYIRPKYFAILSNAHYDILIVLMASKKRKRSVPSLAEDRRACRQTLQQLIRDELLLPNPRSMLQPKLQGIQELLDIWAAEILSTPDVLKMQPMIAYTAHEMYIYLMHAQNHPKFQSYQMILLAYNYLPIMNAIVRMYEMVPGIIERDILEFGRQNHKKRTDAIKALCRKTSL